VRERESENKTVEERKKGESEVEREGKSLLLSEKNK